MKENRVLVSLVTLNDELFLAGCLEALARQTVPVTVTIHDNASTDKSVEIARRWGADVRINPTNSGYAAGHNLNLGARGFDYALLLNADVKLAPDYIRHLLAEMAFRREVGMAGGKLLRMDPGGPENPSRGGFCS